VFIKNIEDVKFVEIFSLTKITEEIIKLMIQLDENGYVKIKGASDSEDSSMFAGIITLFELKEIDLEKYIDISAKGYHYIRCKESIYSFSRDQFIALSSGFWKQGKYDLVKLEWIDGWDIFSPSQMGHVLRCQGKKTTWIQDKWLWLDVYYGCFFNPTQESNQLIAMMKVHPSKAYLKFWCKWNKQWANSIRNYWSENEGAWRGEPELAELMIKTIEGDVK